MTPVLREYIPEDYMRIGRREFDLVTFQNFINPNAVATNLAKGIAFTGLVNDDVMACGGILPLWKGVGEAWVVTSPLVVSYPTFFAKTIYRKLLAIVEILRLERVQTTVDAEHTVSLGWVEWMGFKQEGLMERYIGGRDFYRYARVRGG